MCAHRPRQGWHTTDATTALASRVPRMARVEWVAVNGAAALDPLFASARLNCVVACRADHHEIERLEAERGRLLDRLTMMDVELALAGQDPTAPFALEAGG